MIGPREALGLARRAALPGPIIIMITMILMMIVIIMMITMTIVIIMVIKQ